VASLQPRSVQSEGRPVSMLLGYAREEVSVTVVSVTVVRFLRGSGEERVRERCYREGQTQRFRARENVECRGVSIFQQRWCRGELEILGVGVVNVSSRRQLL
jgi:hypothetical protein